MGGIGCMGTEHTPIPALTWTGMLDSSTVSLTKVTALAKFQGKDLLEFVFMTGPKISTPAVFRHFYLLMGEHPGQPLSIKGHLPVYADDKLIGHPHFDGHMRRFLL